MKRYLDPKADVVFKKVFGEHPHLLKSFLNAVLPLPDEHPIVTLEYLPAEQIPVIPLMRRTLADVKCTDNTGRVFIVEMQIDWIDEFKQRLLFEAGQAYVKQLKKGEAYHLLKPVYGLGLIASNFDTSDQWYHHYQLVNQAKHPPEIIEHLQLVFIELKKFPIKSSQEKKLRLLWLRFLREINEKTETVDSELEKVPEIKEALSLVQESAYSIGELQAYEDYWKAVSSEKTLMSGNFRKGEAKGLAKGLAKGSQETRLLIAKNMLDQNMPHSLILQLTGLSPEQLELLRSNGKEINS